MAAAVRFLRENYSFRKLILYGHSAGAIAAILYAAEDNSITKLVVTGAVGDLKEAINMEFSQDQIKELTATGYLCYSSPGKWIDGKRISKAYYDEFLSIGLLASVKRVNAPLLIVNGENDEVIPFDKGPKLLYEAANEPKRLIIIPRADHMFRSIRQDI